MPNAIRLLIVGWCICSPATCSELSPTIKVSSLAQATPIRRFDSIGSSSCSATACHGRILAADDLHRAVASEFQAWQKHDPHARAGWKLGNALSMQILRDLEIVRGKRIIDQDGLNNCLNCHAPETGLDDTENVSLGSISLSRGVGCESCHGAAEKWVAPHASSDWAAMNHMDRGMFQTKSLLVRARVCVDCHVGAPGRSVNHDLIAAGHPALQFEMTQYHNRLPKHWHERDQTTARFQTQLWWAGQIATADAAALLLESRANDDNGRSTWPELAEFNCSGCHQAISAHVNESTLRNQLAWGEWNFAILPQLASLHAETSPKASRFEQSFRRLASEMELLNNSNRQRVAGLVGSLRSELDEWGMHQWRNLERLSEDGMRDRLAELVRQQEFISADQITHLLLAIVSVQRYRKNLHGDEQWIEDVRRASDQLRFPVGRELPDWPNRDLLESSSQQQPFQSLLLRLLR